MLKLFRPKCVALLEAAGFEPALEPPDPLRRTPVRKRIGYYVSAGLTLQTVVSDGAGRVQRRFDIAPLDDVLSATGAVGPYPGKTVGLQLDPDGNRVRAALVAPTTFGGGVSENAELVLETMAPVCS